MKMVMSILLQRLWIVVKTNYNVLELHQVMAAQAKMFAFQEVMTAWETFVKVFVQRSVKKTLYIAKLNLMMLAVLNLNYVNQKQ